MLWTLIRQSSSSLAQTLRKTLLHARPNHWKPWGIPPDSKALLTPKEVVVGVLQVANFVIAVHVFASCVARPSVMTGPSMLPTFAASGEVIIEEMITWRFFPHKLARGDVVTLESPIAAGRMVCKRVIGLPGDVVCVDPTGELAPSTEHVVIPKGHIWISGDNAAASRDSRMYGPVPMGLIYGRVIARIWPLSSMTIFRNPTTFLD